MWDVCNKVIIRKEKNMLGFASQGKGCFPRLRRGKEKILKTLSLGLLVHSQMLYHLASNIYTNRTSLRLTVNAPFSVNCILFVYGGQSVSIKSILYTAPQKASIL